MAQPFKCPKCGSKDYVVVLTGCNITGATVQEAYTWDEAAREYSFGGSMVVESESVENDGGHAICSECEADVTEAVSAYEQSQPGSGNGETQSA